MHEADRRRFELLESSLRDLPAQLPVKPHAVLVISGHWEETEFAVMASPSPSMLYDYSGFLDYLYHIRYDAPGAPQLARHVHSLIQAAGLPTHLDAQRGFDHGTYSLLAVAYPEAAVPVMQVSLQTGYDPAAHLQLGRALAPLRDEGILIIGSGMSYHNFHPRNPRQDSAQFDAWLRQTLANSAPQQRSQRLLEWAHAPAARAAHPREDHLVPLHVAVGAAEAEPAQIVYRQEDYLGRITLSSYRFGG
jgi:aromatic ring-opening dioxygenase catalytic subunit (LigB family)